MARFGRGKKKTIYTKTGKFSSISTRTGRIGAEKLKPLGDAQPKNLFQVFKRVTKRKKK